MRQYLMLVDDNTKPLFELLLPKVQFLEVQGLNLNGENKFQMLATPVYTPVNSVPESSMPVPTPEKQALEEPAET